MNGDDEQMRSPAKSDTLRSTDSASGGDTLEERSSKEVSSWRVLNIQASMLEVIGLNYSKVVIT